jgi:hypothetical protein
MVASADIRIRRTRLGAAGLIVVLALALPLGCGQQMTLPDQPEYQWTTPDPGTYNLKAVWDRPAPTDLAASGIYLFVIESGERVATYYNNRLYPAEPSVVSEYEGLMGPVHLAVYKRDSTFVVVADSSDMQCKIYYWLGGQPLHAIRDTLWESFGGVALDENLNVYVADADRDVIEVYNRWGDKLRVVADYGTGSGYVITPRGLAYHRDLLVVADAGKNWVQRLDPDTSNVALYPEPIGFGENLLKNPHDVAVDELGAYIFVADTEHHQVLKYETAGTLVDTVYSHEKIVLETPVAFPRYVCAQGRLAFLSDPANQRIVILELASQ